MGRTKVLTVTKAALGKMLLSLRKRPIVFLTLVNTNVKVIMKC